MDKAPVFGTGYWWFDSTRARLIIVAQLPPHWVADPLRFVVGIERQSSELDVAGSIPAGRIYLANSPWLIAYCIILDYLLK